MTNPFQKNDLRVHAFTPTEQDMAAFDSGVVHRVCSTFALAREMEWTGRMFVLEMKEPHEEGIGTFLHITHRAPAVLHQPVECTGYFEEVANGEIKVKVEIKQAGTLIAFGSTGQKILPKETIERIFHRAGVKPIV
jgi:predicted thioesterase